MHQPGRVDVPQRGGEGAYAVPSAPNGPYWRTASSRGSGQELGGDPGPVVGVLGPRVQDRLGGVRLAQALDEVRGVRELGQQHLDGRRPAAVVPAEVHLAQAAFAEDAEDAEDAVRAEPDRVTRTEGFHDVLHPVVHGCQRKSTGRPFGSLMRFMMICELTSVIPVRAVSFSIHRRSYARRSATAMRSRQPGLPKRR